MLEVKILTPQDKFLTAIEFNYDELKQGLQQNLEKYENLVFTEETMKDGKETRAKLNKLKKALDDKRKDIKKQCLEPYEKFETKINELIGLVDKPALAIGNQIKAYEEALKEAKRQEIINYFNSQSPFGDLIKIDHPCFWDEKWLHATKKIKDVEFEIDERINKIKEGLDTIDLTFKDCEFKSQMRDVFLRTLDISKALNEKTRLEAQKKAEEEYKRKQEEIKKAEEIKRQEIKIKPIEIQSQPSQQPQQEIVVENVEVIRKWKTFSVEVSKEEFVKIRRFLIENKIKYEFEDSVKI